VTQDASGVDVLTRASDGAERRFRAAYAVGADGVHSAVRTALDLPGLVGALLPAKRVVPSAGARTGVLDDPDLAEQAAPGHSTSSTTRTAPPTPDVGRRWRSRGWSRPFGVAAPWGVRCSGVDHGGVDFRAGEDDFALRLGGRCRADCDHVRDADHGTPRTPRLGATGTCRRRPRRRVVACRAACFDRRAHERCRDAEGGLTRAAAPNQFRSAQAGY
jgi:FAD binding domain